MSMKIVSCDFSMRRPGFALLEFDEEKQEVSVLRMSNIDNKKSVRKPHGHILSEIAAM